MRRDMRAGGEVSGRLLGVLFPNAKRLWRGGADSHLFRNIALGH